MSIRLFAPAIKHRAGRVCTCGGVYTVDQVPIDLSIRFLDSYSTYVLYRPIVLLSLGEETDACIGGNTNVSSHRFTYTHICGTFKHNIHECSLDEISMPFVVLFYCTCAISFVFIREFRCSIIRISMRISLLGIKIVKIVRG